MYVHLELAGCSDLTLFQHLMQFYFYDFTAYLNIHVEEDGSFQSYPDLEKYLRPSDKRHHAYIIRCDGKIAGFALVDSPANHPDGDHYMTEFFVLKRFRRQGVGRKAACLLFDKYPGRWYVSQISDNLPAQNFWRSIISAYTDGAFTERVRTQNGNKVQYFTSGCKA